MCSHHFLLILLLFALYHLRLYIQLVFISFREGRTTFGLMTALPLGMQSIDLVKVGLDDSYAFNYTLIILIQCHYDF